MKPTSIKIIQNCVNYTNQYSCIIPDKSNDNNFEKDELHVMMNNLKKFRESNEFMEIIEPQTPCDKVINSMTDKKLREYYSE